MEEGQYLENEGEQLNDNNENMEEIYNNEELENNGENMVENEEGLDDNNNEENGEEEVINYDEMEGKIKLITCFDGIDEATKI